MLCCSGTGQAANSKCEKDTRLFFSTHNGQLADHEEIFIEFYKKCVAFELQTTPLTLIPGSRFLILETP